MAVLAFVAPPAQATGVSESGPRSDPPATRDGVDFDAACLTDDPQAGPSEPNHYPSDGGATAASGDGHGSNYGGCPRQAGRQGVSTYDGSTEATDLNSVDLTTFLDASGEVWLQGTVVIDDNIPLAGTTHFSQSNLDTPNETFRGIGLKVLFQNRDKQHNADNPSSGCTTVDGRKQRDQSGHWRDGWHYFVGFAVRHDGDKYVHSVSVGTYDPSPDGGFFYDELGVNDGTTGFDRDQRGASADDPFQLPAPPASGGRWTYSVVHDAPAFGQSTVTISTTGQVRHTDDMCSSGYHTTDYGSDYPGPYSPATYTGDRLFDIKGLSTAEGASRRLDTVPPIGTCAARFASICESQRTSDGGFESFSDTTAGGSTAGRFNFTGPDVNIAGIAYSGGLLGVSDTLGETQSCPTPTFGGLLEDNPFWAASPNTSCEIDDNGLNRGSLLSEWWDTAADYTIP